MTIAEFNSIALGYLLYIKIITTIRDVIDKTPNEDNNIWERMCTILSKIGNALTIGARPK